MSNLDQWEKALLVLAVRNGLLSYFSLAMQLLLTSTFASNSLAFKNISTPGFFLLIYFQFQYLLH